MKWGSLFGSVRFNKPNRCTRPAEKPERSDEKINRILKKRRLIAFYGVTNELENPTHDEHSQRPSPVKKNCRQCQDDQWNPDGVGQAIQRVLML